MTYVRTYKPGDIVDASPRGIRQTQAKRTYLNPLRRPPGDGNGGRDPGDNGDPGNPPPPPPFVTIRGRMSRTLIVCMTIALQVGMGVINAEKSPSASPMYKGVRF